MRNLSPIPEKQDLEQNIRFDLLHLENQKLAREYYDIFFLLTEIILFRTLLKVKPCLEIDTHSNTLSENVTSEIKKMALEEVSPITPELPLE